MYRNALIALLVAGAVSVPASAQQVNNTADQSKMVLDRVVRIDPITSAIIEDGVIYAAVRGKSGGQNGLAAQVCRIASRQDPSLNRVRVVDWNTTRGGRGPQEWRVLGRADC